MLFTCMKFTIFPQLHLLPTKLIKNASHNLTVKVGTLTDVWYQGPRQFNSNKIAQNTIYRWMKERII